MSQPPRAQFDPSHPSASQANPPELSSEGRSLPNNLPNGSTAAQTTVSSVTTRQTGRRILINTGALAGSSLWRIAISFTLQLLIARQLGTVSLGQYTIALAYLNVCQIISELGLPALLVRDLAQQPQLRRSYFRWALRLQVGAALLTWCGLIGVTILLPLSPATQQLLWIVGASLPFYAITSICQTLFQSGERMEYVMGIELFINSLILVISLIVIVNGGSIWQLIGVLVVTQLVSALTSLLLLWQSQLIAGEQENRPWQWSQLGRRAGPFFSLALADVLLQRADIMLLSIFGGETIAGIYSAAYNLLRVALKLIQNFWAALYPTLSRLYYQQPGQYRRLAQFSLHYGLIALLAMAAIGQGITTDLVLLIYGAAYASSGPVLQVLLWIAPFYLLENYTQTLLMVERRPLQSLWITGLHLVALFCLLPLLLAEQFIFFQSFPFLPTDRPNGALLAAIAALIAGSIGVLSSIRLLHGFTLPGRLRQPWKLLLLTLLILSVSTYFPTAWLGRFGASTILFLLFVWFGGLISAEDGQLLRRTLLQRS